MKKEPIQRQKNYSHKIEIHDGLELDDHKQIRIDIKDAMQRCKDVIENPAHQYDNEWALAALLKIACKELAELRGS